MRRSYYFSPSKLCRLGVMQIVSALAYHPINGGVTFPTTEDKFIICPDFCFRICGITN